MENNHHIYHDRRSWNSYRLGSRMRNLEQSQVMLPVEVHNDLHANTHAIAVPSAFVARLGLERILTRSSKYSTLDVVRDSEDYMRSIGEQFHGDATIVADRLFEQIPFIQLGVESLKRRHV